VNPLLVALLLGGGLFFLSQRARAGGGRKVTEPIPTQLEGQPTQTTERAGVHEYEVTTWPEQPDGLVYRFVKFSNQPGAAGIMFSEGPGAGVAFERRLVHSFGPASVVGTMKAEWVVQG